ncbi:hypothetical protein [Hydromonas duriensis]|uniref:Uncharacterized protein n=1 Tax=Hydromonas duriensis TaxID=1527608 RepID=A0A4R6YAF9_9BURK|nr:hypothetical protein [Hydromonas duriensis]TDR32538.1 hypothetical protein DFR44_10351 [Hydromonas duriensis]
MSTRNERYFTTALRPFIAGVLMMSSLAWAHKQAQLMGVSCTTDLGMAAHVVLEQTQMQKSWFVPIDEGAQTDLDAQFLPFMAADGRALLQKNDVIFVQLPARLEVEDKNVEAGDIKPDVVRIVRSRTIKDGVDNKTLGLFIETVGWAQVSAQSSVVSTASANTPKDFRTLPLRISRTYSEVVSTDRLLPVGCDEQSTIAIEQASVDNRSAKIEGFARILALLNAERIGGSSALIVIDKGRTQGVALNQQWRLLKEVKPNLDMAQAFGEAVVAQVFDKMSVLKVRHSAHEVQVGDGLQYEK